MAHYPINRYDLELIQKALGQAVSEIHNPGYGLTNHVDVLDLIDQAQNILTGALGEKVTLADIPDDMPITFGR